MPKTKIARMPSNTFLADLPLFQTRNKMAGIIARRPPLVKFKNKHIFILYSNKLLFAYQMNINYIRLLVIS